MSSREQKEFEEKLSILEVIFSDIPGVKYYNTNNLDKDFLNVMCEGRTMSLKAFSEILIVGDTVINVSANSIEKNLEIVLCVARSLPYNGFLGYLT
jgi:hypothetical protein